MRAVFRNSVNELRSMSIELMPMNEIRNNSIKSVECVYVL